MNHQAIGQTMNTQTGLLHGVAIITPEMNAQMQAAQCQQANYCRSYHKRDVAQIDVPNIDYFAITRDVAA